MGKPVDVPRSPMPNGGDVTADRDVYVDRDGKVVGGDDPSRLTKVVSVGSKVTRANAEKYGLIKGHETKEAEPEVAKVADEQTAGMQNASEDQLATKEDIENKSLTKKPKK